MLLITLDKRPIDCRVDLDGVDISSRVRRIELDAGIGDGPSLVRLTLIDDVTVVGEAGRLEFIHPPRRPA